MSKQQQLPALRRFSHSPMVKQLLLVVENRILQ
jgi:hypothetical protein